MLLGGGCALLLQLAHPLVAAGVADHSDFLEDPLRRLRRTLDSMLTITFGTIEEAHRAASRIRDVHSRVKGVLQEAAGSWPAGTPYDAQDPTLLQWVNSTLIATSVRSFELFVRPFHDDERARYYEETKIVARLLGIPDEHIPSSWSDFERYYHLMLSSGEIVVSPRAHRLARAVRYPRIRFTPPQVFAPFSLITVGLLPESVRERYGYAWTSAHALAFRTATTAIRRTRQFLPPQVRLFPQARAAEDRLSK
jgi:uncharacterized protein (DUF2236 family)